jgi:hypothetical protein
MVLQMFGSMLARNHAPAMLTSLGNILIPPHQQRPNVNGRVVLDWMQLKKLRVLLSVPIQPALLTQVAFTGLLYAFKKFNG